MVSKSICMNAVISETIKKISIHRNHRSKIAYLIVNQIFKLLDFLSSDTMRTQTFSRWRNDQLISLIEANWRWPRDCLLLARPLKMHRISL